MIRNDSTPANSEDADKINSDKSLIPTGNLPHYLPAFLELSRHDIARKFSIINQYENSIRSKPCAFLEHTSICMRNRYPKIQPWAHNNICLKGLSFPENYINASLVKLEGHQDYYIATQGPGTGAALLHFWQMAWQENVEVIVMLTRYIESGQIKCDVYIPIQPGDKITLRADPEPAWGQIECLNLQIKDWGEIRDLRIVKWRDNCIVGEHLLTHLFFTRWPDHQVPLEKNDQVALVNLIKLSHLKMSQKLGDKVAPRIVHCSAGVGRTGTFIALDLLLQELGNGKWDHLENSEDPIFNTVRQLREQRMGLVYNLEQYAFLYRILKESWEKRIAQISSCTSMLAPQTENANAITKRDCTNSKLKNDCGNLM